MNMSQKKEDLSIFRQKIDNIDDEIISLLKSRLEIVKEVGRHKSKNSATQSFIRAGREANMLRDLTKKIDGRFPPAAIANIWRMIISTSLCTEQDMSISAYTDSNANECYWLAREYYGSFVRTICENSADKVIDNVASGKTSIGILPLKNSNWWIRPEGEHNDIFIFARIPFIEDSKNPVAPVVAIANVMPEPTDDDVSVLSVSSKLGEEDIISAFENEGLNISVVSSDGDNYLVEAGMFLPKGDEKIAKIESHLGDNAQIRLMGAYAVPIKI